MFSFLNLFTRKTLFASGQAHARETTKNGTDIVAAQEMLTALERCRADQSFTEYDAGVEDQLKKYGYDKVAFLKPKGR